MGKKSFATEVMQSAKPSEGEIRQLAFFDAAGSSFLQSMADKQGGKIFEKKRGRPRGMKNRDNALLARMIETRAGVDPALFLADIIGANPFEIAKKFCVKPFEVLAMQAKIASDLADRVHGKARQAIEVTDAEGNAVPIWNMHFFDTQTTAMIEAGFGMPQGIELIEENKNEILEVTHSKVTDHKEQ